jgi:hypothetical protein
MVSHLLKVRKNRMERRRLLTGISVSAEAYEAFVALIEEPWISEGLRSQFRKLVWKVVV